ncbi:hypothetical protein NNJEOMEG_01512 [Fundidesulfovibrio magnetotacticus]|uniref:Flp pilus assembly protein TadD n=1 Tax=Fundidesulfovibrio magnetotacticus TaxID=2730080 RepID=A0A6V8LTM6_9BACT|nr:tetratricopeptide repeat protein [Fundidesulfovibrio magnetotacticus]GFK93678.1 hypothetical protein NNJEOMEG_01512 [Fundidesulfovibrio magnetotacticus]
MSVRLSVALSAVLLLAVLAGGCTFPGKASRPDAPGSPEGLEQQGDQALRDGRPDAAAQFYLQAGRAGLPPGRAGLKAGRALSAMGQWEQALQALDAAAKADPKSSEIALLAGYAALRLGRYDLAEKDLRRSLSLRDDSVLARSLLGVSLNRQGRAEEALPELDKALELAGPEASILNNKGLALYMLGRHAQAEEALRQAATLDPLPRHRNNLALALCRLGRFPEAYEQFRLAEGDAAAHNNLGCCFLDAGQPQKAQESFEKALALSSGLYKPAAENLQRMGKPVPQRPEPQGARPSLQESALNDELAARPGPPQPQAALQAGASQASPGVRAARSGQEAPFAGLPPGMVVGAQPPAQAPAQVPGQVQVVPMMPAQGQPQAVQPQPGQLPSLAVRPQIEQVQPGPVPPAAPGVQPGASGEAPGQPAKRVVTNVTGLESGGEIRLMVAAGGPVDPAQARLEAAADGLTLILPGAWGFQGQVVNYGAGGLLERVTAEERADGVWVRVRYKQGVPRPQGRPAAESIPQGLAVVVGK